jgi:hypothetical protein
MMYILYRPFKISSFHLNLSIVLYLLFSWSYPPLCHLRVTLSFVVFLFVMSFTLLITLSYLVITLCLLSKISNLLSQFESGVLLTAPLAISSSLPCVSLGATTFFVVLIPLALQCLHLFSHTLVCCCFWPLRYWGLLPKWSPWTYPLKASPFFQPSLRVARYLSLPWFLFTSCRLTGFVLIPSLAVFLFAITLTLSSIDLALILIFIPTL